jgi:hypothetical protein
LSQRLGRIVDSHKYFPKIKSASISGYEFEPHVDAAVLASQLVVASSSLGLGTYWWFVVVPSERAALAKAKRKGDVGQYLKASKCCNAPPTMLTVSVIGSSF